MATTAPGHVGAATLPHDDTPNGGGGRRRRDGSEPASFGRVRAPSRRRAGLSILGIPVATLVAIELVAVCALLVTQKKLLVAVIAVTVGVLIIVTALLRRRSIRIGTWLLLRIAYLFRQRETLVAAAGYSGGGRDDGAGVADIESPPELEAFFPGMTTWESRTHDGDRMGVVQWRGTCAATLRIGPPGGIVRTRNTSENVPVEAIMAALDGQDLGIDAVQVLTQTIVGEQDPALTPLLWVATAELGGVRARVRNRSTFVTVRPRERATGPERRRAAGGGRGHP